MVGDSANDVLAARNAGCAAVAVSYGYADAAALGADLGGQYCRTLRFDEE